MKVPVHLRVKYPVEGDMDTTMFLRLFDEPAGKVMEVGCHDEPVADVLTEMGFNVLGVDLRERDKNFPNRHGYLRHDFCNLPVQFVRENLGTFDCIISLSAVEHFGLGTYGEGAYSAYYDVIALRAMWGLLREGGTAYLTVPFGKEFREERPHWRVYDLKEARQRLVQDFTVELFFPFVTGPGVFLFGREQRVGDFVREEDVPFIGGEHPHVSLFLKLKKVTVNRLAADGR